jgi:hypothetical protein
MTPIHDVLREMSDCAGDPMWAGHAAVSRTALNRWSLALADLVLENEKLREERNAAYVRARSEVNRELVAAYAEIESLRGQIGVGRR